MEHSWKFEKRVGKIVSETCEQCGYSRHWGENDDGTRDLLWTDIEETLFNNSTICQPELSIFHPFTWRGPWKEYLSQAKPEDLINA